MACILSAFAEYAVARSRNTAEIVSIPILFAVLILPSLYRLIFSRRWKCLVTINREGLVFDHPDKKPVSVNWEGIGQARVVDRPPRLILDGLDGTALVSLKADIVGGIDNAAECAAEINRLKHVYAAKPRRSGA